LLLYDLPKIHDEEDTSLFRDIEDDTSSIFRDIREEESEKSSIFGDVVEDESAEDQSQTSSFSFSSLWGACGISDQVPPPKEILDWMQEKFELLMERRKRRSKRKPPWRKVQHEWGAKPSVDELSACSASSESSSSLTEVTVSTPVKASKHVFVDSDSTSWEATDDDDSLPDPRFLPGPEFRKWAPHSHRENTKYL
jgi:hypothetical protein